MKKVFKIFKLVNKDVLTPSTDFYARHGDSNTDTIQLFEFIEEFDSEKEAMEHLSKLKSDAKEDSEMYKYVQGSYIILPSYEI